MVGSGIWPSVVSLCHMIYGVADVDSEYAYINTINEPRRRKLGGLLVIDTRYQIYISRAHRVQYISPIYVSSICLLKINDHSAAGNGQIGRCQHLCPCPPHVSLCALALLTSAWCRKSKLSRMMSQPHEVALPNCRVCVIFPVTQLICKLTGGYSA